MAFTLYGLILACVLFTNAVAIINERFLKQIGCARPTMDDPPTLKNRLLILLYGDVKHLVQMPLIWINIVLILLLLVLG